MVSDFAKRERIVPIDTEVADRWGWLLDMEIEYIAATGKPYLIGSAQKVEIATAIVGRRGIPFVYVDYFQKSHSEIDDLDVLNPEKG